MDLVRDILDKQVVDRNGRELGRVDGVTLQCREGTQPRIVTLDVGPAVLAERVHPALGRLAATFEQRFGLAGGGPLRIRTGDVLEVDGDVKVDLAFAETPAATVEQRIRRWLDLIPGQ